MKRDFTRYFLLVAFSIILLAAPVGAFAYTYGDANTEDVAETFKVIAGELSSDTPDWKTVDAANQTRRSEIASHFGEDVAVTLDENIKAKDAKLLLANYKAVLVMNVKRRFEYALADVSDYAKAKLLLAKAKATYDTLEPFIGNADKVAAAKVSFESALAALGNPGLFGVGKEDPQPEEFERQLDAIYAGVKSDFPFKPYVKPEAPPTPAVIQPDQVEPEAEAEEPEQVEESVNEAESMVEPITSVDVVEIASPEEQPQAEQEQSQAEQEQDRLVPTSSVMEDHAPMERTNKTNPFVTFTLIGSVIVIGGGVLWFVRKKGYL